MKKIIVIGTEPPCPRCGLLTKVMRGKIKELNISASVEHYSYTSEMANKFASGIGLTTGTAKDVALKLGEQIDKSQLKYILDNGCSCSGPDFKDYNQFKWSPQLDDFLRPFEDKAKQVGILMTPILIIDNEVKHAGSIPDLNKIEKWLKE